jgi:hypothetical protein
MPACVIGFAFYLNYKNADIEIIVLAITFPLCMLDLPLLILHLTHYQSSKGLKISIDENAKTVTFEKDVKFTYRYDQLTIENNLSLYQENKRRRQTPWSNYSYLRVRTFDNKEFYISSIIMNIREFPISPSANKYSLWPSFSNWFIDLQPKIEKSKQMEFEQMDKWKRKFSSLTVEELRSRLEQPKDYDKFPRIAMEELLKEKSY